MVIDGIHDLGMPVLANALPVPGISSRTRGVAAPRRRSGSSVGRSPDMVLIENPTSVHGKPRDGLDGWPAKPGTARLQRDGPPTASGSRVDTGAGWVDDDPSDAVYNDAYAAALAAGLDAYCFTDPSYSAGAQTARESPDR